METIECVVCKEEVTGRSYTYRSSDRKSELVVCLKCHVSKVKRINDQASSILGSKIVTGILNPEKDRE